MKTVVEKIRSFIRVHRPKLADYADDIENSWAFMREDLHPSNTDLLYFHVCFHITRFFTMVDLKHELELVVIICLSLILDC